MTLIAQLHVGMHGDIDSSVNSGDITMTHSDSDIDSLTLIAQLTAEILLVPDSENKIPPCLNASSGFDFDQFIVGGSSFYTRLPNFA